MCCTLRRTKCAEGEHRRSVKEMKKTAVIFTLCLTATISACILWLYQRPPIPEFSRKDPILFPPEENWPNEVIAAFTQFKELKGRWRENQERIILDFARRCNIECNNGLEEDNSAPLTTNDILNLLGPPDVASMHRYSYLTARTYSSDSYLEIYFNRGKTCLVTSGSGLCSQRAEIDELMMLPNEKETEQAGPAYPPQGVGSADP